MPRLDESQKRRCLPSHDHEKATCSLGLSRRPSAAPVPSTSCQNKSPAAWSRSEPNAVRCPSGVHAGEKVMAWVERKAAQHSSRQIVEPDVHVAVARISNGTRDAFAIRGNARMSVGSWRRGQDFLISFSVHPDRPTLVEGQLLRRQHEERAIRRQGHREDAGANARVVGSHGMCGRQVYRKTPDRLGFGLRREVEPFRNSRYARPAFIRRFWGLEHGELA